VREKRGKVACSVDDCGHMDAFGHDMVDDRIRAHGELSKARSKIVSSLANAGIRRQQFERVEQLLQDGTGCGRTMLKQEVANRIEIAIGQV
jgi:hypothetical protein